MGDVLEKIAHREPHQRGQAESGQQPEFDFLHIGQKLTIPAGDAQNGGGDGHGSRRSRPTRRQRPRLTNTTEPKVKATATSLTQKKNKTAIAATASKPGYYTVVKGDNLTKIAHKFKTTPTRSLTANNLSDPKKLSIGEKLKIPSKEARSAKNAEPSDKPAQGQASTAPAAARSRRLMPDLRPAAGRHTTGQRHAIKPDP